MATQTRFQPAPFGAVRPSGVHSPIAQILWASAVFLVIICLYAVKGWTVRDVHIVVEGESSVMVRAIGHKAAAALQAAGLQVDPGDRVWPSLDTPLQEVEEVVIRRGVPVQLTVGGQEMEVRTAAFSVREALSDLGITLGSLDRVRPSLNTPISEGLPITVIRVEEEIVEEFSPIAYQTVRWADHDLPVGETRVRRPGREGVLRREIRVVREDGNVVFTETLRTEVVEPAVDQIVDVGQRRQLQTVRTADGRELVYVATLEVEATAYEPSPISTGEWSDGYTFTGLRAQKGIIAVDPSVIPLGTRLYVPGYGEGLAADIGGAIKGNKIDLFYPTYQEAINWGRRKVTVYILADGY